MVSSLNTCQSLMDNIAIETENVLYKLQKAKQNFPVALKNSRLEYTHNVIPESTVGKRLENINEKMLNSRKQQIDTVIESIDRLKKENLALEHDKKVDESGLLCPSPEAVALQEAKMQIELMKKEHEEVAQTNRDLEVSLRKALDKEEHWKNMIPEDEPTTEQLEYFLQMVTKKIDTTLTDTEKSKELENIKKQRLELTKVENEIEILRKRATLLQKQEEAVSLFNNPDVVAKDEVEEKLQATTYEIEQLSDDSNQLESALPNLKLQCNKVMARCFNGNDDAEIVETLVHDLINNASFSEKNSVAIPNKNVVEGLVEAGVLSSNHENVWLPLE